MSRKVVVQYVASGSPDGGMVYDVKSGRNSILTAGGCLFDPSLLRVVFPGEFEKKKRRLGDELVVPNDVYLSPFRKADPYDRESGSPITGNAPSDASHGVAYEHMTQVCGKLDVLAVHPRLDLAKLQVRAKAYNPFENRDERGRGWISGPTRGMRLVRHGDSDFVFDGRPQLNICEKLVIEIGSIEAIEVYPSDFLATMVENLLKRRSL